MSKAAATPTEAAKRKAAVRAARVWQPTDLLHPIAPESGFVAKAWRAQAEPVFGLVDFDTPTADLLPAPPTPPESAQANAPADPPAPALAAPEAPALNARALEQAREEGRAQGAEETRQALRAEMERTVKEALGEDQTLVNSLSAAIASLQQSPQTFFEPLKRLALHLAEQLVLAELQIDGNAIERLVQRCVDELAQHDESLVLVELNPNDLAALQSLRERSGLNEGSALRLQANDHLLPGSVRASANDAVVEDLIGERLAALARGLGVDGPRWSAKTAFSPEHIARDRIPGTGVEDARPRMAASPAPVKDAGYDTVSDIDDILREAEGHV